MGNQLLALHGDDFSLSVMTLIYLLLHGISLHFLC